MSPDLFARAYDCLLAREPDAKCAAVAALKAEWDAGRFPDLESTTPVELIGEPGRPAKPVLVSPFEVERRSAHTREGRAALIHALAHKFARSKFGRAAGAAPEGRTPGTG